MRSASSVAWRQFPAQADARDELTARESLSCHALVSRDSSRQVERPCRHSIASRPGHRARFAAPQVRLHPAKTFAPYHPTQARIPDSWSRGEVAPLDASMLRVDVD